MSGQKLFYRTDKVLKREFMHYFFPAMLTTAALSLSEFADSMIVSNLLDSKAMSIVQLGSPVMFVSAAIYILLGVGGSTLYAISLGERNRDKAGRLLSVSVMTSVFTGLLMTALGLIFFRQFSGIICTEPELKEGFEPYLRVLLISMPFLITVLTFVSFLPPAGKPGMATAVNIIANVVNIGMDVVYIKFLGMGPEGAAWATVTGYAIGAVVIIVMLISKKLKLHVRLPKLSDLALLKEIVPLGAPFSVTQTGFAVKFAVSGILAQRYAGADGMSAFSLCIQAMSVLTSILMSAVMEASLPIMALLHGQRDHVGEKLIFRNALIMNLMLMGVTSVLLFIFADWAAAVYNITEPAAAALAARGLRIFLLSILLRGYFVAMQKQAQVIGKKLYPLFISLFDGVIGILPICWLFTELMGIDGLFWAYSVTAIITVIICMVWNAIIAKRSNGRISPILLNLCDKDSGVVMNVTITDSDEDITGVSEALQKRCDEMGFDRSRSYKAALMVEEMGVYLRSRLKNSGYMDVLLRSDGGSIEIDFRTIGAEGDPNADDERNIDENIAVLRSIASEIKYDFVMGMNCTEIVLEK